jgi:hypothetical protein
VPLIGFLCGLLANRAHFSQLRCVKAHSHLGQLHMDGHPFHGLSPQQLTMLLAAQVAPAQQFSVRKAIKPDMASKFAV